MRIAVLQERAAGENRVAATPETVKKFIGLGATVAIESGAGLGASIPDAAYADAGAELGACMREKSRVRGERDPEIRSEAYLSLSKKREVGRSDVCH